MPEGYYTEGPDSIDDALDELLCEYVDGTMDPDVRVVFEEYLATDARLAAHVRQLCDTRNMLCSYGACKCASAGLQAQLRVRLASELSRKNRSSLVLSSGLGNVALLTSAVGVVLIVGMMVGLVAVVQNSSDDTMATLQSVSSSSEVTPESLATRDDTHQSPSARFNSSESFRLESLKDAQYSSSFMGPVTALPVVAGSGDMTPVGLQLISDDSP
jgi:anti-sigma-K factor RskA